MKQPKFTSEWGIGEDACAFISNFIFIHHCRSILEFGSGVSTVRWALANTYMDDTTVLSIEHSEKYALQTQGLIEQYQVQDRVRVKLSPLVDGTAQGRAIKTYDLSDLEGTFDLVIIDGPPSWAVGGREACLYGAWDHLKEGGYVVLDDARRPGEMTAAWNWLDQFGKELKLWMEGVGHGLIMGRKEGSRC